MKKPRKSQFWVEWLIFICDKAVTSKVPVPCFEEIIKMPITAANMSKPPKRL